MPSNSHSAAVCRRHLCLLALAAALALSVGFASTANADPVLGLHDGSVNHCDNNEHWIHHPDGSTTVATPDNNAAGQVLTAALPGGGSGSWFASLNVHTIRFSVPWDIALPDSNPSLVTAHDPGGQWPALHLQALANEEQCFSFWLAHALAASATPEVAFKPDYDYRDPRTNHILVPTIDAYRQAISAFTAKYSNCDNGTFNGLTYCRFSGGPGFGAQVHIIAPWGEPDYANGRPNGRQGNHLGKIRAAREVFHMPKGGSTFDNPSCRSLADNRCGPVLAAQMWVATDRACTTCVLTSGPSARKPNSGVVAGDFSSGGGLTGGRVPGRSAKQSYLKTYAQHLNICSGSGCKSVRPVTWAVHSYTDASDEEYCLQNTGYSFSPFADPRDSITQRFLDGLSGVGYHHHTYVWLDEVSVFTKDIYRHASGRVRLVSTHNGQLCNAGGSTLYSPSTEKSAFLWLYHTLPTVQGTRQPGNEPIVNRIYYFRAITGTDGNGDNITPQAPTPNQQMLYQGIVQRGAPPPP